MPTEFSDYLETCATIFNRYVSWCDYTVQTGSATVTHYRLRGYRPGSSDFESWTGTSTTTPNPSDQTITDIVVVASWIS
ncbi:MAG: hypothetical protein ACOYO1_05070 [Bacteroidales bacterium]